MCFPNSAYTLIHTNIVNTVPSFKDQIMTVDNIANYSGYSRATGVTVSPGRLQRISRKVKDSLNNLGHPQIDFTLVLSTNPDESELERRLQKGEVVLAGFSTGIYNKYFEKLGGKRPCVQTYEKLKMDNYPPHYVSLVGIDSSKVAILDPLCNYKVKGRLMQFAEFYSSNSSTITTMDFKDFTSKILFYNNMDGVDHSNRELIYTDVIWKKSIKTSASNGKGKRVANKTSTAERDMELQKSLDKFIGTDGITKKGGDNSV